MPEKLIAGRTVRYDRLPGDKAVRLLLRVLKVMGPAGGLLGTVMSGEAGADTAVPAGAFLAQMDDGAIFQIIMDVAKSVRVDNIPADPGVMEMEELIEVAQFALVSEFGGFFRDAGAAVLLVLAKQAVAKEEPAEASPEATPSVSRRTRSAKG